MSDSLVAMVKRLEEEVNRLKRFDVPASLATGWIRVQGNWTYASATTINVPAGAASVFDIGYRIRLKQGAGYKYFSVIAVTNTLLTVTGGSDYSVANLTITDVYYGYSTVGLIGFPEMFNWTPTFGGFSVDPTGLVNQFQVIGRTCNVVHREVTSGTSSTTAFTITSPLTALTLTNGFWNGFGTGSDAINLTIPILFTIASGASIFNLYKDSTFAAWAVGGAKRCSTARLSFPIG